jgi:hypothetical protein
MEAAFFFHRVGAPMRGGVRASCVFGLTAHPPPGLYFCF